MPPFDLFPGAGLHLDDLVLTPTAAVALLVSTAPTVVCPRCGAASDRVHSRYRRTVADLPAQGRGVVLRLVVRRFRCIRPDCPRRIFCERLAQVLPAHARSTTRLTEAHRDIGFALGGEAGSRLAGLLDMPTSPDTLLRRVKAWPGEPTSSPRCVGIDDWAIRKGQRYGTIVIDLERGRVLDLLPGRDGEALKAWLREHPGVELITRDRWAAFAQAAAEAAPQARQVADRFHLLRNLREAVERLLGRMFPAVHEALRDPPPGTPADPAESAPASDPSPGTTAPEADSAPEPLSPRQRLRREKRARRAELHRRVRELRGQGLSIRRIARETGLGVKAVRRYVQEEHCPDWNPGRRARTQLNAFAALVDDWIGRGGRNAAELHRDLAARGCRASYDAVRRYVARRLGSTGRPGRRTGPLKPAAPPPPPSPRQSVVRLHPPAGGSRRRKATTAGPFAGLRLRRCGRG